MGWQLRGGRERVGSQVGNEGSVTDDYVDTVLVVADDFATRQSLASVLASAEIEAYKASLDEALSAQSLYHPAIALVEHAPGLHDGLGLSARLKERDPDMLVLLLTDPAFLASAQPSELVDEYLVKPLATAAFIQTVRNALNRRGLMVAYQNLADRVERDGVGQGSAQPPLVESPLQPAPVASTPVASVPVAAARVEVAPVAAARVEAAPVAATPVEAAPVAATAVAAELVTAGPVDVTPAGSSGWAETQVVARAMPEAPIEATLAQNEAQLDEPDQRLAPEAVELEGQESHATAGPEPIVLNDPLREALTITAPATRSAAVLFVRLELPAGHGLTWQRHGDAIRARVSEHLLAARRSTDRVVPVDWGSFLLVCLDVDSTATAELIASGLAEDLSGPFSIGEANVRLGVSIGIVLTESGQDAGAAPEALLEDAWLAERTATEEGRPWKLFDDSMGDAVRLRQRLLRAMDNGELDLDFQKIVDLQTGKVVGAEAFLRWRRSGNQVMCAAEFLDKAYDADLAAPLGRWVLDHALSELALWHAANALADNFTMFVNVGAEELAVPEFPEMVDKLLREHGVASTMLSIEMPESALGEAVADTHALRSLKSLGELGVGCVIDDFGTGRSNLDWLHELPVTGLKINPDLVGVLDHSDDRRGTALVRGVIALGHELQMTVVGEGVETMSQEVALRAMGCDLAQGHHLGRPQRSGQLAAALS